MNVPGVGVDVGVRVGVGVFVGPGVFVGVGVFVGPVVPVAVGVYVGVGTIITVLSSPHPINDAITERMRKIEMNNTFEFNIKSPFLLKIHREVLWKFLKFSVFYIKKAFFISQAVLSRHRTSSDKYITVLCDGEDGIEQNSDEKSYDQCQKFH